MRNEILSKSEEMASQALRVLGISYKVIPEKLIKYDEESVENNLVFVGLVGM